MLEICSSRNPRQASTSFCSGWPALHDVGDVDVAPLVADRGQQLVEELAGRTDERARLLILVEAGAFSDKHDLRVFETLARHGVRSPLAQVAGRATGDAGVQVLEG